MIFKLTIEMNNAAFDEAEGNFAEVARILRRLADSQLDSNLRVGYYRPLFDINGNGVGVAEVVDDLDGIRD